MLELATTRFVDRATLTVDALRESAPAAFAEGPDTTRTSRTYTFISTAQLVSALMAAGLQPTHAQQTRARVGRSLSHGKHMLRFSLNKTLHSLVDAIPEIVLINSHDASSAYTLRAGLYRPLCTNGLLANIGDFGIVHVPHRGNVIANVIEGALSITSRFDEIATVVEQMADTQLADRERWDFAAEALKLRYPRPEHPAPITVDQLLLPRRQEDFGKSVWHTFNVVQENALRGGIQGRTANNRPTRTRGIRAIREDVRINTALWQLAMTMLRS